MVLAADNRVRRFVACIEEKKKSGRCTCINSILGLRPLLPEIKKDNSQLVEYQIGVDVLGFPIYVRHEIYKGENSSVKFPNYKPKRWLKVIETIIKQH